VDLRGSNRSKVRVYNNFGAFGIAWSKHLPATCPVLKRTFDLANAIGDLNYAVYSLKVWITHRLASGEPLSEVQAGAEEGLAFARKARFDLAADCFTAQLILIRELRGLTPEDGSPQNAWQSIDYFERHLDERGARWSLAAGWYWILRLQAGVTLENFRAAIEAVEKAELYLWGTGHVFEVCDYHFYAALARATACDAALPGERGRHLEAVSGHHRQLSVWAENCPENFANRAALIGAEIARLEGREPEAQRLYEDAIRSAREHGFVQNEGVAHEVAARFYAARGFETIADAYLQKARYCYHRWGAEGKVRQLDQMHPHLREELAQRGAATIVGTRVEHLDAATVVKVSQAVSGEIVLEKLIDKLMTLAIEQAGADRGVLISLQGDVLWVEAEANTVRDLIEVRSQKTLAAGANLPVSVIRYVVRKREYLLLPDAAIKNPFSDDQYIQCKQSRSILCLPLIKQTQLVGVLYLENNQSSHVFTPARIDMLSPPF